MDRDLVFNASMIVTIRENDQFYSEDYNQDFASYHKHNRYTSNHAENYKDPTLDADDKIIKSFIRKFKEKKTSDHQY